MPLAEDTILVKRYRIDGLLARGGMSAIYRAFDTNLSTPVAIKENFFLAPEHIAQFKQESVMLARLRHPALPRVFHHFSVDAKQYLVMDFIEGENLSEIVEKRQQPLKEAEALNYIIQICQAVSYLHQQDPPVIHRDIKPQNIKIMPGGQAVLVDFGIAKWYTGEKDPTKAGAQGVTPGFSPPEQYSGRGTTPASDIYALGATLYAVLTGKVPPNSITLVARGGKFQPPHKINTALSRQVSQAIVHAMQIEAADRPRSVAAWQDELEAIAKKSAAASQDDEVTVPSVIISVKDKDQPGPGSSDQEGLGTTTHWLVDATGLGYPVGPAPLVIGRHSEADIVIEDLSVSRFQTHVRMDGLRCVVQDNDSANGTFLNGRRLGSDWYPMNPGDILTIGPARYHLTTTQPVKLAPPKPKFVAISGADLSPAPIQTDQLSSLPAKSGVPRPTAIIALLILLGLIGVVVYYFLINPGELPRLTSLFSSQSEPATDQAETTEPVASPVTTVDIRSEVESTAQGQQSASPNQASLGETATPERTLTKHPSATSPATANISENVTIPTRTAPSTRQPPTATLTVTPTGIPTNTVPPVSGPTLIPLRSSASIAQIGAREVVDVDINAKNPREVYALVKGDGIYKSSNSGDGPWAKLSVDAKGVVAFLIDPTNPARFYAPTWNAVLKSIDGGNTWEAKTNGLMSNRAVDVIAINPNNPSILYAGVGEKLVVSTDGGENWSSLGYGDGLGLAKFYQIVIDPFDPDKIYVAGSAAAIYKSTDGGHTFLPMPFNVGQGTFGLVAHPTREGVYLAGINSPEAAVVKTENGWDLHSVSTGLDYGGADSAYSALTYAPSNPNIIYAGSGYEENRWAKGMFKSIDSGENWVEISNGLGIHPTLRQPYYVKAVAVHPTNPDIVLAATGGGLYKSADGGGNWQLQ